MLPLTSVARRASCSLQKSLRVCSSGNESQRAVETLSLIHILYAHIPFCHTLCSYCTFHRFLFKEHVARAYFVNLRKEMDYVKALGYDFHSMYVGGGTTTIRCG